MHTWQQLKKYWQLFWHWRSIQLMRMLQYRGNFFFWSFVSGMWTSFHFFFFGMIAHVSNGIGGWSETEMMLLISVFAILDAFTWSFFFPNMRAYTADIFSGEITNLLLKPIDAQFVIMNRFNSYDNTSRLIIGVVMLFYSTRQLGLQLSIGSVFFFGLFLLLALAFIYLWWFTLSTFAFWVDKLDNINDLIPALRTVWQMPRTIYTGIASFIFTVIFPLGLITSLPSEILLGRAPWGLLVYFAVSVIIMFVVSRAFFSYSVKKFSGVGQ